MRAIKIHLFDEPFPDGKARPGFIVGNKFFVTTTARVGNPLLVIEPERIIDADFEVQKCSLLLATQPPKKLRSVIGTLLLTEEECLALDIDISYTFSH